MDNLKFTVLTPQYVEKSVQCILSGYYANSPNWKAINPSKEASTDFFRARLSDERVQKTSLIVIDTKTDDVVATFVCTDITLMKDPTKPENRQKDARIQLMSEVNYRVFKPLIDVVKAPGVCLTGTFYSVHAEKGNQKVGQTLAARTFVFVYEELKYKIFAGSFYNKVSKGIMLKAGAQIWNRVKIDDIEFEGQKIFADLKDGGELLASSRFDDEEDARKSWGEGLREIKPKL